MFILFNPTIKGRKKWIRIKIAKRLNVLDAKTK
jgi:hypothetical protein